MVLFLQAIVDGFFGGQYTVQEIAANIKSGSHSCDAFTLYLGAEILGENVRVYFPNGQHWTSYPQRKQTDIFIAFLNRKNYRTGYLTPPELGK